MRNSVHIPSTTSRVRTLAVSRCCVFVSTPPPLDAIAPVLGRVPSGIFILTAKHGEQETGMLASWVMQAGFEPPAVTVAVRQGRYLADWLKAGTPFVLNLVAEKQHDLLKHFGKGFAPEADAFGEL